jgi:hypothetical protein
LLHGDLGKDLAGLVFGLLFQAVVLAIIGGILLPISALRGSVEMEWVARVGLVLQLLGIMLLLLDYAELDQSGPGRLRWWVRSRSGSAANAEVRPGAWPGQMVVILAVAAIVLGLALQLLGSFR